MYGRIGEERYREYAHLIHESGEHLLSVVNEVLDMSKIEAGKFEIIVEPFTVGSLVNSCREVMHHLGEKKSIALQMEIADQLPELVADKRACKQIILNLMANAIKFTETGGKVVLAVRCQVGQGYEFQVSDTGIGIAPNDIPKAMSQFGQVDSTLGRQHGGTGLGLPLTKALVELHGGSLDLQSQLDVGTTVTVHFPAERVSAATSGASIPAAGRKTRA